MSYQFDNDNEPATIENPELDNLSSSADILVNKTLTKSKHYPLTPGWVVASIIIAIILWPLSLIIGLVLFSQPLSKFIGIFFLKSSAWAAFICLTIVAIDLFIVYHLSGGFWGLLVTGLIAIFYLLFLITKKPASDKN